MAIAFAWQNTQNNSFLGSATTTNVGASNALGSNGAFTAGTVLLAMVIAESASQTFTFTGWSPIDSFNDPVNGYTVGLFSHVCTGAESGSFPVSWGTSAFSAWTLQAFTGCSGTPVDVHTAAAWASGGGTSVTTASITPTQANDLLVLHAYDDGSAITVPGDMTQRFNVTVESGTALAMASDRASSGLTAQTETFGTVTAKNGGYFLTALAPPSAGGSHNPTLMTLGVG